MDLKQNPFSFYDFLGYFTPGALFLFGIIFTLTHINPDSHHQLSAIKLQLGQDTPSFYVAFVLLSYVTGHLLNFLSSVTIERYAIWIAGYPSKFLLGQDNPNYFSGNSQPIKNLGKVLVWISLFPISGIDYIFGKLLGLRNSYTRPLDPLLKGIIAAKFIRLLEEKSSLREISQDANSKTDDYFRFVYHYCVENAKHHLPKMQNYVALYGFLRTLTFLFVIFFWILFWHLLDSSKTNCSFDFIIQNSPSLLALACVAVSCYVFYMAFFKFYRRFSLEVYMALTASI